MNLNELIVEFMGEVLVPQMVKKFSDSKPVIFQQWSGNCCRQIARLVANVFSAEFGGAKVYEGVFVGCNSFKDGAVQEFDHSWCSYEIDGQGYTAHYVGGFGLFVNKSDDGMIDWSDHPYMKLVQVKSFIEESDWEKNLTSVEFYTDRPFIDVVDEVREETMNEFTRRYVREIAMKGGK